ncbi:hypothetical protein RclHR1_05830016 [Rhizophagus clarus]|uniref:Protein kinase domain-containing protein n=1 Tax=Rhizophagus clarus TaxID=94130 RepID=A0A2Z6RNX6_9GLOM|nr:hypothetical protein RclHR1_05830016 [Rhizophagus clarus]
MMIIKPSNNNEICEKCNFVCNTVHFQQNFKNWTSGNKIIDKFIQNIQLSTHHDINESLEWISYDRFCNIDYVLYNGFYEMYKANWIDGTIFEWNNEYQNWERIDQNMFVILKSLNNLKNEFMNKFNVDYEFYGITQNPETKSYLMVLNNKRQSKHFQPKFENWTSGNIIIDRFIKNTQLSAQNFGLKAFEWIPYDRFCKIKYIAKGRFGNIYRAIWIDGHIEWDNKQHNWKKQNQNLLIKRAHEFYGITRDLKANYIMVYKYHKICETCNFKCNAKRFQQNFENWTSGNDDIDKYIRDIQSTCHTEYETSKTLEWIPYDRLYDIQYIAKSKFNKIYRAKWIDGCIDEWDNKIKNWKRYNDNMVVITVHCKVYGITQDPITKEYMIALNEICKKCKLVCYAKYFQQNFENWTSGNDDIDKFIQDIQLTCHTEYETSKALERIPYNRFYDNKFIAQGGFAKVYRAKWIDGYIDKWDNKIQNWKRINQNMYITSHFKVNLNKCIIKLYGITQDPVTKNYVMVLDFAENGNLRNYLNLCYNKLSWNDKFNYLHSIAHGIRDIHEKELIHRDLHIGNILRLKSITCITDMGLCKPADYNLLEKTKNNVYGVLPYIAPEILRGQNYTKSADIYSFGIIMYEVISGLPPYSDVSHDDNLAIKICKGLRPRFKIKVPQLIVRLIKRCLDANQLNRPKAEELKEILSQWFRESSNKFFNCTIIQNQIKEAENINYNLSASNTFSTNLGILYETHSEAIYTSRLFNFNNLPEPKNSDDYYEENDNIISIKSSASLSLSLQIDIRQLNINNDDVNSEYRSKERI